MSTHNPADLTDAELNRAIARAIYKERDESYDSVFYGRVKRISYYDRDHKWLFCEPPNYAGCLNACAAAEESYFLGLRSPYEYREKAFEMESHILRALKHAAPAFRATARQRAEAIYLTLTGE